jgi:hypothetical protein
MKSLEEMKEWLREKIWRDTEWMKAITEPLSNTSIYTETKKGVEICNAILAALLEKENKDADNK